MLVVGYSSQLPPLQWLAESSSSARWLLLYLDWGVSFWERSQSFPERSCLLKGRDWAIGRTQNLYTVHLRELLQKCLFFSSFLMFHMLHTHLIGYKRTLSLRPSRSLLLFMLSLVFFSHQPSCLFCWHSEQWWHYSNALKLCLSTNTTFRSIQ